MWPCWSVRNASTTASDLIPITPVRAGDMVDVHGGVAPMYLVGYFRSGPVYRTTLTNAFGIDTFSYFKIFQSS